MSKEMSDDDIERTLRDQLHSAIDPLVPGPNATTRVMDAVTVSAAQPKGRSSRFHVGQGLATVLVASLVVLVVGGALGVSLALRGQTTPNGTSTHHVAPFVTPTPAPTPTSTPVPTPTPAVVAACDGTDFTTSFLDFDGAAGSEGGDIMLKNTSAVPCTMDGYTMLEGVANGRVMQLGVVHVQATLINNNNGTMPTVKLLTLQPGEAAYVAVEWTDVQSSSAACPVFKTLLITPPQGSHGVTMTLTSNATPPFMLCALHGTPAWIDEAPVSRTRYFEQQ
jgi:hypothetical protein